MENKEQEFFITIIKNKVEKIVNDYENNYNLYEAGLLSKANLDVDFDILKSNFIDLNSFIDNAFSLDIIDVECWDKLTDYLNVTINNLFNVKE